MDLGTNSAPISQGVLTPLSCADPEFATSTPLPIGPLNFDQVSTDTSHSENELLQEVTPEPNIQPMTSIRQQNGTVQGQEGDLRPPNITYPAPTTGKHADFELKGGLIAQLSRFRGFAIEDPHEHL